MKRLYILIYHFLFWIYRVIYIWAFVYFLYGEPWYKGAYAVQLVLIPFFYINYGLLIPFILKKKYVYYFIFLTLWILSFVWVYSHWTIYQGNFLYGDSLRPPDYIETVNNIIYIWLISSGVCLFEFWIKNRNKNQKLALDRKRHLLESDQNLMLNNLLSDYLNTLDKSSLDELPDKILLVSDFFKYLLYNRDKKVTLATEISYIKKYEEIKNYKITYVKVIYKNIDPRALIRQAKLISIINRFVEILYTTRVMEITIEQDKRNQLIVSTVMDNNNRLELIVNEFCDSITMYTTDDKKVIVSVDKYLAVDSI